MRVLVLHNRYRQAGGEDAVVRSETAMLREHGVEVIEPEFDNDSLGLRDAFASSWSQASYDRVLELCRWHRPGVAHVHNFWARLSPSAHAACHDAGVATVQTLHNFRLLCGSADFLRAGKPCEECLGKSLWRGVARRCYRGSLAPSVMVVRMITSNRARGTWQHDVDAFIALNETARAKFILGGLPPERVFVKPNFVEDPGEPLHPPRLSADVVFVGRLVKEKGVAALLSAWNTAKLGRRGQLFIAGDGPDRNEFERLAGPGVIFLGQLGQAEVLSLMATARAFILPSLAEQFPRTLAEAFAQGRPAVVCNRAPLNQIVRHGHTGLTCDPADPASMAGALEMLLMNGALADRLGRNARTEYLVRYTPERNFGMLMDIYRYATSSASVLETYSTSGRLAT